MEALRPKNKMHETIINECLLMDIETEHIDFACKHADYIYEMSNNFSSSVSAGIAVAQGLQMTSQQQKKV